MIDLVRARENPEMFRTGLAARGQDPQAFEELLRLDKAWRAKKRSLEELRHRRRAETEPLAHLLPNAQAQARDELRAGRAAESAEEKVVRALADQRLAAWLKIPNVPLASVPEGKGSAANRVREAPRSLPVYDFRPRDYLAVAEDLGLLDLRGATRSSGARFGALLGEGVLLELALIRHALEVLVPEGFVPVMPPVLIREVGMRAMGYLDVGSEEVYRTQDDLLLVGTSEQSVGAMHLGVTFRESDLPRRFVAFSSCFRREAGSHGRDVRGILRVHQFDKVEMFSFTAPEESAAEHARLLNFQKRLLDDLALPYRVVDICAGDLGFPAAAQVDLETWFPARGAFVETHSTSNTTDFQTRRLRTTFRASDGKIRFAHAVNGTAYAIQRTLAAILEVHQTAERGLRLPEALRPHLSGRAFLGS